MFEILEALLDKCSLNFSISKKGSDITVTVIPQNKEKEGKYLSNIPFVVSGTADELDKTFTGHLLDTMTRALTPLNNAEEFVAAASKQEADVKEAAKKKAEAKATTSTSSAGKFDASKLTGNNKKAYDTVSGIIKKIMSTKDIDMVSYLQKQAVTECAKMDAVTKEYTEGLLKKAVDTTTFAIKGDTSQTEAEPLVLGDKTPADRKVVSKKKAAPKDKVVTTEPSEAINEELNQGDEDDDNTDHDPEADNIEPATTEEEAAENAPPATTAGPDDWF